MREPDWESLAHLQFLLYNRIADSLNAALSSIALSGMPEASDQPPGFWQDRATAKIANVLNLFTAWSNLIRFKRGETIPRRVMRPFSANVLIKWLATQLQLHPIPTIEDRFLLEANQETLQEALLLLHSAAFTQGTSVRLELETTKFGIWFRVRFTRMTPLPDTLEGLLESFGDHWRAQDTRFELTTARDFIRLNGSKLIFRVGEQVGEFAFFVWAAGAPRDKVPPAFDTTAQVAPSIPHTVVISALSWQALGVTPVSPDAAPTEPETPLTEPVEPPTLAVLRPRPTPPGVSPVHKPAPEAPKTEGAVPPEPAETVKPPAASEPEKPTPDIKSEAVPPLPSESAPPQPAAEPVSGELAAKPEVAKPPDAPPAKRKTDTLIVPVKIPAPKLPESLRKPPASTSNVALTKETQTMRPVAPEGQDTAAAPSEPPAAASSDSPETPTSSESAGSATPSDLPASSGDASAPDQPAREETS